MSGGKKNEFTPEREQKVEDKVFVGQHIHLHLHFDLNRVGCLLRAMPVQKYFYKNQKNNFCNLKNKIIICNLDDPSQSNLSAKEWEALRNLASNCSIVIKGADKGSSVVVWDRADYILEAKNILMTNRYIKKLSLMKTF